MSEVVDTYLECCVEGCTQQAENPVKLYTVTGWFIKVYTCDDHKEIDNIEQIDPNEP